MKRVAISKSILVLLVSVLITSISFNSFAQRGPRAIGDSTRFDCRIPNLTAEQKTKMDGLRVKHLKEVTQLRNELAEKKAHLNTLESAEKVDRDAISKTIDEISILHGKIMKSGANHRLEVSSNLTDEQKVFFNAHQRQGGKGQMGMGNGMKHRMRNGNGNGNGNGNRGNYCPNNHPNCPAN